MPNVSCLSCVWLSQLVLVLVSTVSVVEKMMGEQLLFMTVAPCKMHEDKTCAEGQVLSAKAKL